MKLPLFFSFRWRALVWGSHVRAQYPIRLGGDFGVRFARRSCRCSTHDPSRNSMERVEGHSDSGGTNFPVVTRCFYCRQCSSIREGFAVPFEIQGGQPALREELFSNSGEYVLMRPSGCLYAHGSMVSFRVAVEFCSPDQCVGSTGPIYLEVND